MNHWKIDASEEDKNLKLKTNGNVRIEDKAYDQISDNELLNLDYLQIFSMMVFLKLVLMPSIVDWFIFDTNANDSDLGSCRGTQSEFHELYWNRR